MSGKSPICKNSNEIGTYIGVDKRSLRRLKEMYGLPVWKIEGKGNWKALKSSLDKWLVDMEKKFL